MYFQQIVRIQRQQEELLQKSKIKKDRIKQVLDWVLSIEKGQYTDQQKQGYYKTLSQKSQEYGNILTYLSLENKKLQLQKLIQQKQSRPKVPIFHENDTCWQTAFEFDKCDQPIDSFQSLIKEEQSPIQQQAEQSPVNIEFEQFTYNENISGSTAESEENFQSQQSQQLESEYLLQNQVKQSNNPTLVNSLQNTNKQTQKRFESFESAINKLYEDLNLNDTSILEKALEICSQVVQNQSIIKGKQSNIVAGAIIYLSGLILVKPIHQRKIAGVIDCKEKTLFQVCESIKSSGIVKQTKDISEIQVEYIINKFNNIFDESQRSILKHQALNFVSQLHQNGLVDGEQKITLSTYSVYVCVSKYLAINLKIIADLADMCEVSLKNFDNKIAKKQQLTQVC